MCFLIDPKKAKSSSQQQKQFTNMFRNTVTSSSDVICSEGHPGRGESPKTSFRLVQIKPTCGCINLEMIQVS